MLAFATVRMRRHRRRVLAARVIHRAGQSPVGFSVMLLAVIVAARAFLRPFLVRGGRLCGMASLLQLYCISLRGDRVMAFCRGLLSLADRSNRAEARDDALSEVQE